MKKFIYMLCISANFAVYAQGEDSNTESNVKKSQGEDSNTESNVKKSSLVDSDRSFDSKEGMLPVDKSDSKNVITSINPENDNELNHAASTKQYDNSPKFNKMVDVPYEEDENKGNEKKRNSLKLNLDEFHPLNYSPETGRITDHNDFLALQEANKLENSKKKLIDPTKWKRSLAFTPFDETVFRPPYERGNRLSNQINSTFIKEEKLTDQPKNLNNFESRFLPTKTSVNAKNHPDVHPDVFESFFLPTKPFRMN